MNLLRVLYEPGALFAEVREKPAFWLPLIACALLALVSAFLIVNLYGLDNLVRYQLESNPRMAEQLGQDKIDQLVADAANSTARKVGTYVVSFLSSPITVAVLALILFGLMLIGDQDVKYPHVLTVSAYSFFAYTLVSTTIFALVLTLSPDRSSLDPGNFVVLNPTIFFDKATTSKFLYSIMSSLDLLSFWAIGLLGLGLSKIGKKMTWGKGVLLVVIPWAIYVLGKSAVSAMF